MESPFLKYATIYADKGWYCFPVGPDKKPLVKWGDAATTDLMTLQSWGALYPDACIGISCGPSKLVVLDVDVKSGGLQSLDKLKREIPEIETTVKAHTGSGGLHYYFKCPEGVLVRNSASKIDPGLDIRADGGYVVAPPSKAENGEYRWGGKAELQAVPQALLQRIESAKPAVVGVEIPDGLIPPHTRHSLFLSVAGAMRARGATSEAILNALRTMNAQQCIPPHDDADIVRIAMDYGKKEVLPQVAAQIQPAKAFQFVPYSQIKREDIDWLWHGRIPYGRMTLLVGEPGKTKSYLTCAIAAHVSTGRPLPDDNHNLALSTKPHDVLMLNYEDGQGDTVRPRLDKCGADLSRIFTVPMDHEGFSVEDVIALEKALNQLPDCRLIIIDPMQNIVGKVDDYNDAKLRVALNPLIKLAFRKNIAILGVKHLSKDEGRSINHRIGASIGYVGLARNILVAGWDNENPGMNGAVNAAVLATKGNLSAHKHPVTYTVDDHGLHFTGVDPDITQVRLVTKPPKKD